MGTVQSPDQIGTIVAQGNQVALIAGPTASGKSDVAVKLALALKESGREAVIINADSAQVYADLQVLSARPTEAEMQGIPHRLFGTWDGAVACSAADWAEAAKREIAGAHAQGFVPILVGGTGLYVRTLLDGIAPVPAIDPAIREQVRAMPQADARKALSREDSEAARRIALGDTTRTSRALEVIRSTGKPLSEWQTIKEGGIAADIDLHPLILLPEREWLYERCDQRFAGMMQSGAVEEVETLMARNLSPELPVMRAIGVRQIAGELAGEWERTETLANGAQATRNYAKRQYTWFRNQPPEDWKRAVFSRNDNNLLETNFARLLQSGSLTG